ncbi:MAG: ATP synthase F1 subunit delta [Bacteroidetes bacterium]|nr:ATP synthase F1 subunit delta [Bacteroidota bacterium]
MPNPRLAARYAKSLLDLSIERNELDNVYSDILFLQSICKSNKDFVAILKSPVISPDRKQKILQAITTGKITTLTASFNTLLVNKGREAFLPEIVDAFVQQYKQYKGIHIVKLTTATPVSDELKNSIVDKIKSSTSMQKIELNTEVKEDILGGFILEVGDQLVDASVAFDLNNIKMQFRNNDFIYKIR